jgi:hypothetical protein
VGAEEDSEDLEGVGHYLQGEDVAFWPGTADSGAAEDRKRMKLTMKTVPEYGWRSEMTAA